MLLEVREMELAETGLVIDYFHGSSAEHLELLGVDPTRLPSRSQWKQLYEHDHAQPIEKRRSLQVLWLLDGQPLGFSSVDKIVHGREAYMHLHVFEPGRRQSGFGAACVRQSAQIYFDRLALEQLFCEPNAFNVAPHRTLQRAGFRYVKTHRTVPGPLNFHQVVTRWVLARPHPGSSTP